MNLRQIATATIALSSLIVSQSAPLFAQSAQQQGFNVQFPHLHDPFKTYTPVNVPKANLTNSRSPAALHSQRQAVSFDRRCDRSGARKQPGHRGLALHPAHREHGCVAHRCRRIHAGCSRPYRMGRWAAPGIERCLVRHRERRGRRPGRPGAEHFWSWHPGAQLRSLARMPRPGRSTARSHR